MSNTQKNWNNYWKDYEPSRYDNIYHNMNGNNHHFDFRKIFYILIPIIVIGIFIIKFKELSSTYGSVDIKQEGIKTAQNSIKIDNANGKIMADNVSMINGIIKKTNENMSLYSNEDIDDMISKIENANLSYHYNEYKNAAVKKLNIVKQINNETDIDKQNELIHEINNIELFDYLADAFDKVGVDYWREENRIHYKYKK